MSGVIDTVMVYDAFRVKGNFSNSFQPTKFSDNAPGALVKRTVTDMNGKVQIAYKISIGLVNYILDAGVDINPNRYAVGVPDATPIAIQTHQNTLTLTGTNGKFISLKFHSDSTFVKWHQIIRECLANLIFEQAFRIGPKNEVDTSKLEYAIMMSGPLVEEDHGLVVRAKSLWMTKLQLHDVVERLHNNPQSVRKEELRILLQQLMDESTDPIIKGDSDAVLVVGVALKVLSKKDVAAYLQNNSVDETPNGQIRSGPTKEVDTTTPEAPAIATDFRSSMDGKTPAPQRDLLLDVEDENMNTSNFIRAGPLISKTSNNAAKPVVAIASSTATSAEGGGARPSHEAGGGGVVVVVTENGTKRSSRKPLDPVAPLAKSPKRIAKDRKVPLIASPAAVSLVERPKVEALGLHGPALRDDDRLFEIQQAEAVDTTAISEGTSRGVSSVTVAEVVSQDVKSEEDLRYDDTPAFSFSSSSSSASSVSSATSNTSTHSSYPLTVSHALWLSLVGALVAAIVGMAFLIVNHPAASNATVHTLLSTVSVQSNNGQNANNINRYADTTNGITSSQILPAMKHDPVIRITNERLIENIAIVSSQTSNDVSAFDAADPLDVIDLAASRGSSDLLVKVSAVDGERRPPVHSSSSGGGAPLVEASADQLEQGEDNSAALDSSSSMPEEFDAEELDDVQSTAHDALIAVAETRSAGTIISKMVSFNPFALLFRSMKGLLRWIFPFAFKSAQSGQEKEPEGHLLELNAKLAQERSRIAAIARGIDGGKKTVGSSSPVSDRARPKVRVVVNNNRRQ